MSTWILTMNEAEIPTPPPAGETPPPPPPAGEPAPQGEINVLMVILAYFGILCLIPFFAEKEDEFVQYHAKQGLTLMIAEIVGFVLLWIVAMILTVVPLVGCLVWVIWLFFWLGLLVYHVILMVRASKGERVKIPYISMYAERWFG